MAKNRKNIEKIKAQFLRCKADRDEQIEAIAELLEEMLKNEKNYNKIYNKLAKKGILALKLNPKIAQKCYNSGSIRAALSAIKNTALLFYFLPREYEKIMDFHRLSELWENLNRISQKLLEGKMT